jgi:malate synthase
MENTMEKKSALKITGQTTAEFDKILTDDALAFIQEIETLFGPRRKKLL